MLLTVYLQTGKANCAYPMALSLGRATARTKISTSHQSRTTCSATHPAVQHVTTVNVIAAIVTAAGKAATQHTDLAALLAAGAARACNGMTVEAAWITACREQISGSPCSPAWRMTEALRCRCPLEQAWLPHS